MLFLFFGLGSVYKSGVRSWLARLLQFSISRLDVALFLPGDHCLWRIAKAVERVQTKAL